MAKDSLTLDLFKGFYKFKLSKSTSLCLYNLIISLQDFIIISYAISCHKTKLLMHSFSRALMKDSMKLKAILLESKMGNKHAFFRFYL